MIELLFGIILSLIAGSVLTVLGDASESTQWIWRRRSQCSYCHHPLAARDLIPVVSMLLHYGRCRFCHVRIPLWHHVLEYGVLPLFLVTYALGYRGAPLVFIVVSLAVLLTLAVVDIRFFILPDPLVLFLGLIGLFRSVFTLSPSLLNAVSGALLGLLLLGSLTLITRERAMGWGDVKLAGVMGILLGPVALLGALLLSFIAGGIVGGVLIALRRANFKSHLPFGPFLAASTAVLLLVPTLLGHVLSLYVLSIILR